MEYNLNFICPKCETNFDGSSCPECGVVLVEYLYDKGYQNDIDSVEITEKEVLNKLPVFIRLPVCKIGRETDEEYMNRFIEALRDVLFKEKIKKINLQYNLPVV